MESNLTDKQIDKIMFHYFDDKFKNSFFGEEEIESGTMWTGFFVSDSEHMLWVNHIMMMVIYGFHTGRYLVAEPKFLD